MGWSHWNNTSTIIGAGVLGLCLLISAVPVTAGKIYKIVDSAGNVTFSDRPPQPEQAANLTTEKLELDEDSSNRSSVTKLGPSEFCGDIKLPDRNISPGRFLERVSYSRKSWERQLSSMEASVNRAASQKKYYRNTDAYNKSISPEKLETMRDYRCAINWANNATSDRLDQKDDLIKKAERQTKALADLERRKTINCGAQPEFGSRDYSSERQKYRRCVRDYDNRIRIGKRELQEVDRDLSAIRRSEQ